MATCPWCRPLRLITCCCGYEAVGKRRLRRRLPDEALSPRAAWFRWHRRVYEDLRPIDRRYASGCLRLAAAVRLGPKQAHDDAAEALARAVVTRDAGRSGFDAEQQCRRYFRELYLPPEQAPVDEFTVDTRPGS